MGVWNFYIELKADCLTIEDMITAYNNNMIYQEVFGFRVITWWDKDNYCAEISSVIDNFLPANYLIYNFLSQFVSNKFTIKTNNIECEYNFIHRSDFVKFMYDIWQSKIDLLYSQFGTFVINYKDYYKLRNKLFKKYYKKII